MLPTCRIETVHLDPFGRCCADLQNVPITTVSCTLADGRFKNEGYPQLKLHQTDRSVHSYHSLPKTTPRHLRRGRIFHVIFQRVFEFPFSLGRRLSVGVLETLQWQVLGGFPVEEEEASTHLNRHSEKWSL